MALRWKRAAVAVTIAMGLAGCAGPGIYSGGKGAAPERNEVPIAGNYPTSTQFKLQAAEHWRLAANDAAAGLVKSIRTGGACIPGSPCTTLYLRRSCETSGCAPQGCDTTFNRVFFNEFLTALVGLGYQVSAAPSSSAMVVDIDVQAIGFSDNRPQYRYAGKAEEIGPGIWALRDEASLVDAQGAEAPRTSGLDANWYRTQFAAGPTPRNELVITVSAMSRERVYLARNTSVYYTADSDAGLYSCPERARAAAPEPAASAKAWTIPVIGDCTGPRCLDEAGRRAP